MINTRIRFFSLLFAMLLTVSLTLPAFASGPIVDTCDGDCTHAKIVWEDYEEIVRADNIESAGTYNLICTLFGHDYSVLWMSLLDDTSEPTEDFCWIKTWTDYYVCSRCEAPDYDGERRFTMKQHPDWEMNYSTKTCTDCGYVTARDPIDGFMLEPQ